MDNQVRYTVTANDMLSGKLQGMNSSATALQSTLGGLKSMLGVLGVGFAVFKGLEFIRGGVEKAEALHQAFAQVEAGLESTGGAAGMTMESIKSMADEMSGRMKFAKADIIDMQAQMLTFGGITKENFPAIGDAIANVATKIGMDLHGMAIQFGKAMENPSEGIRKLQRQGVMFSKEQREQIDKLVAKGEMVKAQQIMLTEIQNKYGGSSKAAFDTDPLARFSKMMGKFQVAVGNAALALLEYLMPALEAIAGAFKKVGEWIGKVVGWIKKHSEGVTAFVQIIGALTAAYIAFNLWQKITLIWAQREATWMVLKAVLGMNLAGVTGFMTAAQLTLNAAFAANPIGMIIIAIAAVIAIVVVCYKHFAGFRAFLWATWAVIKEVGSIIVDYFSGLKNILIGTFTLDGDQVVKGMMQLKSATFDAGARLAKASKEGWKKGMEDFAKDNPAEEGKEKKTKGLGGLKPMTTAPVGGTKAKDKTKEVSGSKVVTINVTIGNLINDFQIKTTNIQESTNAIKDKVLQALTSAVNDSQIVAGQ